MIRAGIEAPTYEKEFIRCALFDHSIRLDGRGIDDYRELCIKLERGEASSTSEVQLGSTLVITVVTGEIVSPFPDRPVEGILQFTAHVSPHTELTGTQQWELTRMLERSLKDSEALDTESLCIVGGERVWQINCAVSVVDGSGGNVIDACMLSVMSALKAFRKPDVSVVATALEDESSNLPNKGFNLTAIPGTGRPNVSVLVHHSNNREPLPLSLHHTPITVTLGILKGRATPPVGADAIEVSNMEVKTILLSDISKQEEAALDGKITFSINAHNELCAMNKPAGRGLTPNIVVQAAKLASVRASMLHERLNAALSELEETVKTLREKKLETMQRYTQLQSIHQLQDGGLSQKSSAGVKVEMQKNGEKRAISQQDKQQAVGIDRNDPILQWSSLHQAAGLWE